MNNICLRKLLEENVVFPDDHFKIELVLLFCNVCKKIASNEKLNKYEELFVLPIYFAQRRDDMPVIKLIGINLLENLAKEFGNADNESVKKFLTNLQQVAQGKMQFSHEWLNNISEGTYYKIVARLYWTGNYDLLFWIAIIYINNMTVRYGSSVRTNWYYKNNKADNEAVPFFQIGIALDEGIVETITIEIMQSDEFKELIEMEDKTKSSSSLSEAYFFERKFVDKIIDTFKLNRKEFLGSSFSPNCLNFLAEETRKVDYCDLNNLLYLSDQQRWKEVNTILKKYRR